MQPKHTKTISGNIDITCESLNCFHLLIQGVPNKRSPNSNIIVINRLVIDDVCKIAQGKIM